jgi:hypothetical protein
MYRHIFLLLSLLALFMLTACGDNNEENTDNTVKTENAEEGTDEKDDENIEESTENKEYEFNQLIVDNENIKATLVKIAKLSDEVWGNSIEVVFEIENKREDSIEVQARSVSADGRMVDDTLISMSQEIAPGKSASAKLEIMEMEGYEFPELTSDFEMTLHVFSWENYEFEEDHPVNVQF